MSFLYKSANDAFLSLAKYIYKNPDFDLTSRVGKTKEKIGVHFSISNPYNRFVTNKYRKLSFKYIVGEWLWYDRASNSLEEISYYSKFWNKISDDNITANSAYGYRILNTDKNSISQWDFAKKELILDSNSRRSIVITCSPSDMTNHTKDFPCTVYLQFLIRNSQLFMIANMRSNDLFLGFANDVACFTLWQEKMLNELREFYPNLTMGSYFHNAGSLHIYERNYEKIKLIINNPNENTPIHLPKMKNINEIVLLQENESRIRDKKPNLNVLSDPFCVACQKALLPSYDS